MYRSFKSFAVTMALLLFIATGSVAAAADSSAWTVRSVSGKAEIQAPGSAWQAVQQGQPVLVGASIRTAQDSRVVLARDDESVTIAAASSFEFKPASSGMLTRIFQEAGTLMFKVHKRPDRHFEVGTPYLVAVVKGTTFTVSVDDNGSAVHVTEGLVEVAGLAGPDKLLLHPGQTGGIGSKPGSKLQSGQVTPDKDGAKTQKRTQGPGVHQAIQTASLDVEEASDGLFKNPRKRLAKGKAALDDGVVGALLDGVGGALGGSGGAGGSGGGSGGALGGAVDGLGGAVGGALGGVGGAVSGLSEGLGGAVGSVTSGVGGAVSGLSSGVGGALGGGAGSLVSGVGGAAGGAVSDLGSGLGGAISGLGGGLGGALGGLGGRREGDGDGDG
jgi:hypothetical protein